MKNGLLVLVAVLAGLTGIAAAEGEYLAGDFHQHSLYTD